ncbi:MAG: SDR family oxidoreductase [Bacilli bacterium]|nr:SDR family oxidoreductase [Bacilli bacterium]
MLAIVTGSSKGIGKELVIELAKKNYDIVITYNTNLDKAKELKEYIKDTYKVNVMALKCDISKEEDIALLKKKVLEQYDKIDILINNAALAIDNSIDDKTKEEFMKVLEVNVVGTFLVTKYLYKYMDDGVIVNISSTDSVDTYNNLNIDYSVSKAGINMLTKVFAYDFKKIKVIGVMPNWTNTESVKEMNPEFLKSELERIGQDKLEEPDEVAKKIVELAFDDNITTGEIRRI